MCRKMEDEEESQRNTKDLEPEKDWNEKRDEKVTRNEGKKYIRHMIVVGKQKVSLKWRQEQ